MQSSPLRPGVPRASKQRIGWTHRARFLKMFATMPDSKFRQLVIALVLVLFSAGPLRAQALKQPGTGGATAAAKPSVKTYARRPNIILILADDLGYGDLGCYGQAKIQTPNLDRMAAEGMRFTSFYVGSPVCMPSRAALMLGQHSGHLNLRGNVKGGTLLPEETTVAQVLQSAGYYNCLLGKWGLAEEGSPGLPKLKGFDQFLGYLENKHAHDYYPSFIWRYDPVIEVDGKYLLPGNQDGAREDYVPDICSRGAVNFLRVFKPDQFNQFHPLFLFLSYTIPHANNEEGQRTGNGMQVPSDAPYATNDWPQVEKNKAAMITRMDSAIGGILTMLRTNAAYTNTLVIFTSDNGPHKEGGVDPEFFKSSGPLRGIKRDLTEGGIRVPFIAWWPGKIKPGQTTDVPAANWDLMPTFAGIAQTNAPKTDGISLLPLLTTGAQTNRHEFLYWEFYEGGFKQAARLGKWKGLRSAPDAKLELYDLETDLGEKQNVAAKNPDVVAKLEAAMKQSHTDSPQWPIKPQDQPAKKK